MAQRVARQVSGDPMSAAERAFATELLQAKPNLQLFRSPAGAGAGDFIAVDMSRPLSQVSSRLPREAFAFELKGGGGVGGKQLTHAEDVARNIPGLQSGPLDVRVLPETAPADVLRALGVR